MRSPARQRQERFLPCAFVVRRPVSEEATRIMVAGFDPLARRNQITEDVMRALEAGDLMELESYIDRFAWCRPRRLAEVVKLAKRIAAKARRLSALYRDRKEAGAGPPGGCGGAWFSFRQLVSGLEHFMYASLGRLDLDDPNTWPLRANPEVLRSTAELNRSFKRIFSSPTQQEDGCLFPFCEAFVRRDGRRGCA